MIVRRKVNRNFTVIPNEIVNDTDLSFEALGLLTYLLSRPHNWQVKVEHLRGRGDLGRDKAQRLIRQLIDAGYVIRRQNRETALQQFSCYEYVVYDEPKRGEAEPEPEIPVAEKIREIEPQPEKPEPEKPEPENQAAIIKTESNKSFQESSAPNGAGAEAPTVGKMVWKEAIDLLSPFLPEPRYRRLIGKWFKRAKTLESQNKLLAAVRATARAGTHDPVPYLEAAINAALPPPPDPATLSDAEWAFRAQVALSRKEWSPDWGPKPGERNCLLPASMMTTQLMAAVGGSTRNAA